MQNRFKEFHIIFAKLNTWQLKYITNVSLGAFLSAIVMQQSQFEQQLLLILSNMRSPYVSYDSLLGYCCHLNE